MQKILSDIESDLDKEIGNKRFECDREEKMLSNLSLNIRKLRQVFGIV